MLRGTEVKKEFTSMHLRRLVVNYLKFSLASVFGQDRPSAEEVDELERTGKIKPQQAHDYRLPGPFSFAEYVEYILTDGTWGDDHVLTLLSCMWQLKITILNADTLGET